MKSVLLNKHSLEIAKLAEKDASRRYTLNAVQVAKDATYVTNAHYLVRVEHPKVDVKHFPAVPGDVETVEADSFLVERGAALELLKVIPKKTTIPVLAHVKVGVNAEGNISAITTDLETHRPMTIKKTDSRFPQTEQIWPRDVPALTICLDGNYVAELAKMAAGYSKSGCVRFQFWDATKAIRMDAFDSNTEQHFTAVLMSMRGEVEGSAVRAPVAEVVPDPFADAPEFEPLERTTQPMTAD